MASLAAVAWEARRRGLTYGELAARLTPDEEMDIEVRFRRWKAEHGGGRTWGGYFVRAKTYPKGRGVGSIT